MSFKENKPYMVYQNVTVENKREFTKTNPETKEERISYMTEISWQGGSRRIYSQELYEQVEIDQVVSIKGNINDKGFFTDDSLMVAGGTSASGTGKRRSLAA